MVCGSFAAGTGGRPASVRLPLRLAMESASPGSPLRRLAAATFLVAIAASSAASLVACGGEQGETNVEGLLDRAFRKSIGSADVKIDAQIAVDGLPAFERPVRIQASGPYIGGRHTLPKLDLDLTIGAQGAGQTVQSGVLSTGDRAFVKFGGEFYEQTRADVERANRQLRRGRRGASGSLRDFGLEPRRWVVDARDQGVEKVGGVETRHVSGRLDTHRLFRDLNRVVERSANAVGGRDPDVPDPLSSHDIDRLAEIVRSPTFDVYVGEDDDVVRRVSASLEVRVPEGDRDLVGGIEGGSLRFSVDLLDVDGDQVVRAPLKSRPIGDLTKQLGGLGALAGRTDQGSAGAGPDSSDAPLGNPGAPKPEGSGAGAGGAGGPEVEDLRRYADCLDRAGPNDTRALSRCKELLR